MAEDLSLKFGIDSEDAKKGVADVEKAVGGVADSLKQRLTPAAEQAYASFEKLSKAEGPRALQKSLVEATIAMENFKAEADKAAASGQKMSPTIGTALRAMQGDIDAGSKKLGQLKDVMGDVASRSNQAGQSFEYLRGAGGGVGGMLNALESSSSGALSSVGKLGIATLGVAGVFGTAVAAGKLLAGSIDSMAEKQAKLQATTDKTRASTELHAAALRAAEKGLIAFSDTTEGLIKNYDNLILAQGRGSAAAKQAAADYSGVAEALKKFADETGKAEALGALLEGAFKRSSREGTEMARLMEADLRKIEASYKALGDAVPLGIRKAIDSLDGMAAANKRGMESAQALGKEMASLPAAMQNSIEAEKKLAEAARLIADSHDKVIPTIRKVLEVTKESAGAYDTAAASLAVYAREHKLTAEQVLKMATEQANLAEKTNKVDEEMAKEILSLGALGGALDTAITKTKTAAQVQKELNAAYAAGPLTDDDIGRHEQNAKALEKEAEAAKSAADAFGRLAGGLTAVRAQADNAMAGLQGVAWEMRKATKETFTLNDSQKALIESLAVLSDAGGNSSLWVGHLVAQLEKGTISFEEFTQKINQLLPELAKMGGSMGNTASELNAINTLLAKFKQDSTTGWPGGPKP